MLSERKVHDDRAAVAPDGIPEVEKGGRDGRRAGTGKDGDGCALEEL